MIDQGCLERKKPLKPDMSEIDNNAVKSMIDRGWTDHDASLSKKKVKKTENKEVDFQKINAFLQLKLQMEMDFTNKIESFNCIGMADPFDTSTTMTEASA